jgi:NAD dependent epimerase/dehydratase family
MNSSDDNQAMSEPRAVEAPQVHGKAGVPPILVTGGTGTLGRLVVLRLRDAGCTVRVLSRRRRAAGAGIAVVEALQDHIIKRPRRSLRTGWQGPA